MLVKYPFAVQSLDMDSSGNFADGRFDRPVRTITWAILAISLLLLTAQLVGAFVGLNRSSFWFDELWTVSTITPATLNGVLHRTAEDVHPPFYFLISYFWIGLFGLTETSLRMLSALSAVGAALSLLFASSRFLRPEARLYACLTAVTSICWIDYSQMARMYGLGFLIGSWVGILALHILERIRGARRPGAPILITFAALCFAYSFTHFYMFLACGDVLLVLIVSARRWPDRLALIGIGVAILIPMIFYVRFLAEHTLVDVQNTWMSNSTEWLLAETWQGLRQQVRPEVMATATALVAAALWISRYNVSEGSASPRLARIMLTGSVPLFLMACGILLSFAIAPNYSARNLAVAAPFCWLAIALLIDFCLDGFRARSRLVAILLLFVACLPGGARLPRRWIAKQEEFRAASLYIREIPACHNQPIPIIRKDTTAMLPRGLESLKRLYGYYLERPAALLPLIDYSNSAIRISAPSTDTLLARRLDGVDPCPVLGLMVHAFDASNADITRDLLRRARSNKMHLMVAGFPHFAGRTIIGAFVFLRPSDEIRATHR